MKTCKIRIGLANKERSQEHTFNKAFVNVTYNDIKKKVGYEKILLGWVFVEGDFE